MTAISVFSTFTNNHGEEKLQFENLENLYMISDSLISLTDGINTKKYNNQQKIFYDVNTSVVMGIAGSYNIGRKIIKKTLISISNSNEVLNSDSLAQKVDVITNIIKAESAKIHNNNFPFPTTIVCNTVFNEEFASLKYFIPAGSNVVQKSNCEIKERIQVTTEGFDGKPFETYAKDNAETLDAFLSPATKHFTLFLKFLHSNVPDWSGPPCQGVVLNYNGSIKELSIKHPDGFFYKMGIKHVDRVIRKYEIDYRDENFNFLSASNIK
jgi:hypothetical protein